MSVKTLTLADARVLLAAAEAAAERINVPYNAAVVDAGGRLIAFSRMDGAWIGSIDIAIDKAYTARAFDMSTEKLSGMAQSGKPLFGIHTTNAGRIVIFGGGAPVMHDETVIGALGVSGGTVDQDTTVLSEAMRAYSAA